jgi:hypothetical protein
MRNKERSPHPATLQRREAPSASPKASPHPATLPRDVVQRRAAQERPPHPATVVGSSPSPFHAAISVQRRGALPAKLGTPTTAQRASDQKSSGKDMSAAFQLLIDGIGAGNVLEDFASFLGREDMGCHEGTSRTRDAKVPGTFTGLAFDGVHWKGYENGALKWDSYKEGIQLGGTNNYCQSYACFLWASRGLLNATRRVTLIAGKYAQNVMKMSALWLGYFKWRGGDEVGAEWLDNACPNWKKLIGILELLSSDEAAATDFATSKQ